MPGPCSTPDGDRRRHDELNEIVCDTHFVCYPGKDDIVHTKCDLVTLRVWLYRRGRLKTGKTVVR